MPKSIQYERQTPPVIKAPSIITSIPRLWDLLHSLCQVGTVDVFRPFPIPVTIRPAMKCGREKAEDCRMAPMIMMREPRKMLFLRPRMFPTRIVAMAPQKHPTLYDATDIP